MSVLTNAEKIARLEIKVNKIIAYLDTLSYYERSSDSFQAVESSWNLKKEINDALKMANLLEGGD